jgi:hypothetical protein
MYWFYVSLVGRSGAEFYVATETSNVIRDKTQLTFITQLPSLAVMFLVDPV